MPNTRPTEDPTEDAQCVKQNAPRNRREHRCECKFSLMYLQPCFVGHLWSLFLRGGIRLIDEFSYMHLCVQTYLFSRSQCQIWSFLSPFLFFRH